MPTDTAVPAVRAKFRCQGVRTAESQKTFQHPITNPTAEAHRSVTYGDGTDNAAWSKATSSGSAKMHVTSPDASSAFVAGHDYYLDFRGVAPIAEQDVASADLGNLVVAGVDGTALGRMQAPAPAPAPQASPPPQETEAPAAAPTTREPAPAQAA